MSSPANNYDNIDFNQLALQVKHWGMELGFQQVGICDTELTQAEHYLDSWLGANFHGDMHYMEKHGHKRSRPADLVEKTVRIISVRMNYFPEQSQDSESVLADPSMAFISRYALGRDYHKVIRQRLQRLATKIENNIGPFGYRVFTDSAPVLEKAIAEKSGLGWIGKHSNLINEKTGSWFFLGEIYTDLPLPIDQPSTNHCGSCQSCIDACPTDAIIAPYQVDARLCISYLTIELKTAIPIELRKKMGTRIYGCDDCQMVCPWNRFTEVTDEIDFKIRNGLDTALLLTLFNWDETYFLKATEGSAIRRIGYQSWIRNIAVALGNVPSSTNVIAALKNKLDSPSELIREHVFWALDQHTEN